MRLKNICYLIAALFLLVETSFAQEIRVSGFVKDSLSAEPLIGAYILCPGSNYITSTNNFGYFSTKIKQGTNDSLIISYIGYRTDTVMLNIKSDTTIVVWLQAGVTLEEVSVVANISQIAGREQMSLLHVQISDFKVLPSFVERDAIKSLQLLPGIASGSEGQSGLNVRGGSPDQNLFLLDGVTLYHVNHLGNYLSVFETEALKDIKLFKGAFPARYGNRLSSVVDIRVKDGNKYSTHGNVSLGLLSASVLLEGPIKKEKSSYLFSFRRFWPDIFMVPLSSIALDGGSVGYNFYDNIIKTNYEITSKDKMFLSFYFGRDAYSTNFHEKKSSSETDAKNIIKWGNALFSSRWTHVFGPALFGEFSLGYTNYQNRNIFTYDYKDAVNNIAETYKSEYFSGIDDYTLNSAFEYSPLKLLKFKFGGGGIFHNFNPGKFTYQSNNEGVIDNEDMINYPRINAFESFLYVENEIDPVSFLSLNLGLRWSGYNTELKFYQSFEPRLSANVEVGSLFAISASYSKMQQYIHLLTNSGLGLTSDLWMPSTSGIPPEKSDQFAVGVSKSIENVGINITVEGYIKKMSDLVTFKEGAAFFSGTAFWEDKIEKNGIGDARGIEILLQKATGNTTGWISYSLSSSNRQFENINRGLKYPYSFDRRHDLSVVLKRKLNDNIDISATWVYGSGLPITLATGKYKAITSKEYFNNTGSIYSYNFDAYLYEGKNGFRMRDYHRLDVGINFYKEKRRGTRTWSLNIYNVYNRQNPLYYYIDYPENSSSSDGDTPQMKVFQKSLFPIMPTINYSFKF